MDASSPISAAPVRGVAKVSSKKDKPRTAKKAAPNKDDTEKALQGCAVGRAVGQRGKQGIDALELQPAASAPVPSIGPVADRTGAPGSLHLQTESIQVPSSLSTKQPIAPDVSSFSPSFVPQEKHNSCCHRSSEGGSVASPWLSVPELEEKLRVADPTAFQTYLLTLKWLRVAQEALTELQKDLAEHAGGPSMAALLGMIHVHSELVLYDAEDLKFAHI
jgi:hypothetical protein